MRVLLPLRHVRADVVTQHDDEKMCFGGVCGMVQPLAGAVFFVGKFCAGNSRPAQ